LGEILGYEKDSIEFLEESYEAHYVRTPYAYQPKLGKKFIPPVHVDLGQGILQVVSEIDAKIQGNDS